MSNEAKFNVWIQVSKNLKEWRHPVIHYYRSFQCFDMTVPKLNDKPHQARTGHAMFLEIGIFLSMNLIFKDIVKTYNFKDNSNTSDKMSEVRRKCW